MDEEIIKAHGWWIIPSALLGLACCIAGVVMMFLFGTRTLAGRG